MQRNDRGNIGNLSRFIQCGHSMHGVADFVFNGAKKKHRQRRISGSSRNANCTSRQNALNGGVVGIPRRKELTVVGVSSFSRGWGPPTNIKEGKLNNE